MRGGRGHYSGPPLGLILFIILLKRTRAWGSRRHTTGLRSKGDLSYAGGSLVQFWLKNKGKGLLSVRWH